MKISAAVVVAIAASATSAHASIWEIEQTTNLGNNSAGVMTRLFAHFNSNTGMLRWEVDFSDTQTDGFTLAINDGPNPKGHAGELALIYFDATTPTPTVLAYAYNGKNSNNSYQDGNGDVPGVQTPDMIMGASQRNMWVTSGQVVPLGAGQRFILEIQVATIQAHNPLYPSGNNDWTGIGFADKIGWWFHTYADLQATYANDGLTGWSYAREGWSDKANITTTEVPAPGAIALAGAAALVGTRRRRR